MKLKRSAYRVTEVPPAPTCASPLRVMGLELACDRPAGHLPVDDHASTFRWKTPIVAHPTFGEQLAVKGGWGVS